MESVQKTLEEFDKAVAERLDDTNFKLPNGEDLFNWDILEDEDDILLDCDAPAADDDSAASCLAKKMTLPPTRTEYIIEKAQWYRQCFPTFQ